MTVVTVALWISAFLFCLNVLLAIIYRKRRKAEVGSYYAVCVLEALVFVVALLVRVGVITSVPFHLPPGLPVDRIDIGAALAFGIGLFPAAFWNRVNLTELPKRIVQDGRDMKKDAGVKLPPKEWMN
jgi:hypothetical protein